MAGMKDQMALVMKLKKAQKELSKEVVEVEAGDGAVVVQINGELKIVSVKLDPELIDLDNVAELEGWIKAAMRERGSSQLSSSPFQRRARAGLAPPVESAAASGACRATAGT